MTIYGKFLEDDRARLKAECRITTYIALFTKLVNACLPAAYASFRDRIGLNEGMLAIAVGRYFNDRHRLLEAHDIEAYLHRSKMVAYTIKWILATSPIYSRFSLDEMNELPEEVQERIVNLNYIFCTLVMFDGLEELEKKDFAADGKYERILRDLIYCMKTQAYSEKMGAVLFDALCVQAAKGADRA
ncbi:hypothetical protein GALL_144370 [mine drainage metagenome]|uniref:Uncharacterized protein n=1 Tax=mine drainage metagenome TaxID=410659 RepID=A0A1J5S627_9ZZZZ